MRLGAGKVQKQNAAESDDPQLTADLFHALSQPLTTLTCLLETAQIRPRRSEQSQRDLQIALRQIQSITRLVRTLRELDDAGNALTTQQALRLDNCLREVIADLQPVAASKSASMLLTAEGGGCVNIPANRLRPALYHLAQFAFDSSAKNAQIIVTLRSQKRLAVVEIMIRLPSPRTKKSSTNRSIARREQEKHELERRDLELRSRLVIARRIFESANGSLQTRQDARWFQIEVILPLARKSKSAQACGPS